MTQSPPNPDAIVELTPGTFKPYADCTDEELEQVILTADAIAAKYEQLDCMWLVWRAHCAGHPEVTYPQPPPTDVHPSRAMTYFEAQHAHDAMARHIHVHGAIEIDDAAQLDE